MTKGFHPIFTITNRITAGLTHIERARGFLEAATLSEDWVREMGRRALVLEAHHTTHIEGTRLTLDQAERLWQGDSVPEADPDDARELLNYRKDFDFVSEYLASGDPITEGLIREIHKRLVEGVRGGSAAPGQYRKIQNYVVNSASGETIYTPPPAHDVPIMMAELVGFLSSEADAHPVLVSGNAQFQLVHIIPFWTATAGHPGCYRPCVCTGRDMILSGCLPSASIMIGIGRPFTVLSRAYEKPAWT